MRFYQGNKMAKKCALLSIMFILLCCVQNVQSKAIDFKITAKSPINSINSHKNMLYISTDSGEVEIWDLQKRQFIKSIVLDNIIDIFGKDSPPRVFSTHTLDNKKILIVSQNNPDKSNISIYNNGIFKNIDLGEKSGIIKNAFFVSDDEVLIAIRSYEILLYNTKTNKIIWSLKPHFEVFTDLKINGNLAISSTEGGKIYVIDIKNGEILKILQGANFDYIYSLGSAKNIALTAGRDKICGIYHLDTGDFQRIKTEFMAFVVAISEDSTLGAVSYNENGDILLFKTQSLDKIDMLVGEKSPIEKIIFVKSFVATFSGENVIFWEIKQ